MAEPYWTDAQVLQASESKLYHPHDATVREDAGILLVHMPEDYGFSVVQRSYADTEARAQELIEEVLAETACHRAALGGQQLLWWVRPSTVPSNMADLLLRRGFEVFEEAEILGFDLFSSTGAPRNPFGRSGASNQVWRVVRSLDEMRLAHELRVRSMGSGGPQLFDEMEAQRDLRMLERLEESYSVDGAGPAPRFAEGEDLSIEFLAYEGRRAVSTAGLTISGDVGNFWGAATDEEYRHRGAYHLLVGARSGVARRLGATLALVKARPGTSGPLLRAAGFRRVGVQVCYSLRLD